MNEESAPEPTDVEVDALDNFDLGTPAEVEARQAASQEEPGDEPVVETEVAPVKPETNPDSETLGKAKQSIEVKSTKLIISLNMADEAMTIAPEVIDYKEEVLLEEENK